MFLLLYLLNMGRRQKYFTKEEQRIANIKKSLKYYYKNQEKCKKYRMKNYYDEKSKN